MRVIKNINNNVSLCLDSKGNEVVAFGKGLGFTKPPYDIPLSRIERTFYNVNPMYIDMINSIPEEIIFIASKIVDYARTKLENPISSNIVFTLADHIYFAIQRFEKNMNFQLPIEQEIQHLFENEVEIGKYALKMIKQELKTYLPKVEAVSIALHIINAEAMETNKEKIESDYIREITGIIEEYFEFKINQDSFNYARFVTHMYYLIKRVKTNTLFRDENKILYESLKSGYERIYECSLLVKNYIENSLECELSDEECIYLMLHINRLCEREDCDQ